MAGGSGTRFWPASRAGRPKQFLAIGGDRPLLAETIARLRGLVPSERTWVCMGRAHLDAARGSLEGTRADRLILEPEGRDTAACVALTALRVSREDPAAALAILPADHRIEPAERFRDALRDAAAGLGERELMTFGIRPRHPATGYGYIETGGSLGTRGSVTVHRVASFREKPDAATAQGYVAGGRHLWNAGIFLWRASAVLEALRRHAPDVVGPLDAVARDLGTPREEKNLAEAYGRARKISIDYALLEPAAREGLVTVAPVDWDWDDVGSWTAAARYLAEDAAGNRSRGLHEALESAGCVVVTEPGHLVVTYGVRDLLIVQTPDATLVCDKNRAEDLKRLLDHLRARGRGGAL